MRNTTKMSFRLENHSSHAMLKRLLPFFLFLILAIDAIAQYDYQEKIENTNLIFVRKGNRWGAIDNKGNVVIPVKYRHEKHEEYDEEDEAYYKEQYENGEIELWEYNEIINYNYISRWSDNKNLLLKVEYGGRFGMINIYGQEVIPTTYEDIGEDEFDPQNLKYILICAKKNGKYGYIDENNNIRINFKYDSAWSFYLHDMTYYMARVKLRNKWGYIYNDGTIAIPIIYDRVGTFSENVCFVEKDGRVGAVDIFNNIVIPFQFDAMRGKVGKMPVFKQDVAIVSIGGKCGAINHDGEVIVPFEYELNVSRDGSTSLPIRESFRRCGVWGAKKNGLYYIFFDKYGHAYTTEEIDKAMDTMVTIYRTPDRFFGWTSAQSTYPIQIHGQSGNRLIKEILLYINGEKRDIPIEINDQDFFINTRVPLSNGINNIRVVVALRMYKGVGLQKTFSWSVKCTSGKLSTRPQIDWISFHSTSTSPNASFEIGVKSESNVDVDIFLNGTKTRAASVVVDDGYGFRRNYTVSPLTEGTNTIRVVAKNAGGTTTEERTVTYNIGEKKQQNKRIALIIGNQSYKWNTLTTPKSDIRAVTEKLRNRGFDVESLENLNADQFRTAINNFVRKSQSYNVALLYYAGHGHDLGNEAYLEPVDVDIRCPLDIADNCISVNSIVKSISRNGRTSIVIIDACQTRIKGDMGDSDIDAINLKVPDGTILIFSTEPGVGAIDGEGHSPFCKAFLRTLDMGKLSHLEFFERVKRTVFESTKSQKPRNVYGILQNDFYFNQD